MFFVLVTGFVAAFRCTARGPVFFFPRSAGAVSAVSVSIARVSVVPASVSGIAVATVVGRAVPFGTVSVGAALVAAISVSAVSVSAVSVSCGAAVQLVDEVVAFEASQLIDDVAAFFGFVPEEEHALCQFLLGSLGREYGFQSVGMETGIPGFGGYGHGSRSEVL